MALSDEVKAKLKSGGNRAKFSRADVVSALKAKPHPDPLADVEYTDDIEHDTKAELNALGKGLSGASKEWAEQFGQMNDSEYWVALCFKNRAAKDAFLANAGVLELGDKYLDGHKAAEILGIDFEGR